MKIILCLVAVGACLGQPLSSSVITKPAAAIPASIKFDREVIQQVHGEDGTQTTTYYFSLNGDYAAVKPDPKSDSEMSLMVYTNEGLTMMFNNKQKTVTVIKMARVVGDGAKMSKELAEQMTHKKVTKDKQDDLTVTATGKTKTICGYPAVEYEIKNEGGKAYWYYAKVDFNPIKIYTMGAGDSGTQATMDAKKIQQLKNNPMGIPVLNKNYLLAEMSTPGGPKGMETKAINKTTFAVSTTGYKVIDLSKKGLAGMIGAH
ncbi:MAG: hypothetical protein P0Y49_06000 [Candidatus Pedobacter colombiensis]|uniref:DUF4412 domain-containing protein n=1 Tax=Candidatus Pedobacter colombiensis TaxID=3121371 RepID=A0AAJ5WAD0_9SPHI|nr:hypothetical protein [Pedobacter sp.]WEK20690.1 MAG: hypothetical protein P0Y49_06000 [Pedobacter sp.]